MTIVEDSVVHSRGYEKGTGVPESGILLFYFNGCDARPLFLLHLFSVMYSATIYSISLYLPILHPHQLFLPAFNKNWLISCHFHIYIRLNALPWLPYIYIASCLLYFLSSLFCPSRYLLIHPTMVLTFLLRLFFLIKKYKNTHATSKSSLPSLGILINLGIN